MALHLQNSVVVLRGHGVLLMEGHVLITMVLHARRKVTNCERVAAANTALDQAPGY